MKTYVALLRAVNVGGTGKLPMVDLVAVCDACGFAAPRTYIQSGNVVFGSRASAETVRTRLAKGLAAKTGATIDLIVIEATDLARVLQADPFPTQAGSQVLILFSSEPIPTSVVDAVTGAAGEVVVRRQGVVYVHYPHGMGQSKLKLPKLPGYQTARNRNTIAKLVTMATGA